MKMNALPDIRRLSELVKIDPASGIMTWASIGRASGSGRVRTIGALATCEHAGGYLRIAIDGKYYRAHRVAFALYHGRQPRGLIDHIDGDPHNNSFGNLRETDERGNRHNVLGWGQHGKGVYFDKRRKKNPYRAVVQVDGETIALGSFSTAETAQIAYLHAARTHFGEFATARWAARDMVRRADRARSDRG